MRVLIMLSVGSFLYDSGKSLRIIDGKIGEDLAVDLDILLVKGSHQSRIGGTILTGSGINACDPELSEFTFAYFAVAILVQHPFFNRILRKLVNIFSLAPVTFRLIQNLAATATGSHLVS